MNILFRALFNTYVKSISSYVYVILTIVSLIFLNNLYKINEKFVYEFNYSIILNSIQDYQSSTINLISNDSIYGVLINHHSDFIKVNNIELELDVSVKEFNVDKIQSDKFKLYAYKENVLTKDVFMNYLNSLEKSFEERIKESYITTNQINDLISNQSKLFFYNLINKLERGNLLNEQLSIRYNVPLTNGQLNFTFGENLFNEKFSDYKQFNIDELEALNIINFPVSFKTNNNDYSYEFDFISNQTTKNKIVLSIIIITILLILLHPIIIRKLNDIVSEAR